MALRGRRTVWFRRSTGSEARRTRQASDRSISASRKRLADDNSHQLVDHTAVIDGHDGSTRVILEVQVRIDAQHVE